MGGKSTTSTSGITVPANVLAQYNSVMSRANQVADTPFQQYGGQFVAPVNAQQTTGIGGVNTAANEAQPYYSAAASGITGAQNSTQPANNAALGLAGASAEQVNAQQIGAPQINQFMNPYLNTVLGSTSALLNQNNQQQQAGQLGNAITSGAFGGDRTGIAAANLEQQQNLANANIYSGIGANAFNTALGAAQQQQGVNLEAGQANRAALANAGQEIAGIGATQYGEGANTANTLAALGSGAQSAGLQGAQAQIGAGTLQQQTQQASDQALYNQFLQQQSYPFQVTQFLGNLAEGTGALSGSQTTTTQPGGFFSDKRLKTDIKKIGRLYDGQHIVSYKLHGDPRTRVGLIAQDVEKDHPEAVGVARGYKIVDYGKATEDAANKGHFAEGGVVPRRMYAVGGASSDWDQILAAHGAMYGESPQGAYGLAAGVVPRGGSSRVPAPVASNARLMTPQGGLRQQPTGLQNLDSLTKLADEGAQIYKTANRPTSGGVGADSFDSTVVNPTGGLVPAVADDTAIPTSGFAMGGAPYSIDPGLGGPTGPGTGIPTASSTRPLFDYGGEVPTEMAIPDDPSQRSLAQAPPLQSGQGGSGSGSGLTDLADIAKIAGTAAEIYGMFAKRGGRIGKDDGGDVQGDQPPLDPIEVDSTKPIQYTGGLDPVDKPVQVAVPDKVDTSGGVGGGVAPSQDHWWKHAENVVPLLTGLAAMGTAPTRSWGRALATGLGAGAEAYLPAHQEQANIALRQAQAGMAQTQLGVLQGALKQPPSSSGAQAPERPTGPPPTDPTQFPGYYQSKYAPVTPAMNQQEEARFQQAKLMDAAWKTTAFSTAANQLFQQRVAAQNFTIQQAAQHERDAAYAAGDYATVNAIHPWTGDQYKDAAGSMRNSRTGDPMVGSVAQNLTPQQASERQIALAKPETYGAGLPTPLRNALGPSDAPGTGAPTPAGTTPPAASAAPRAAPRAPAATPSKSSQTQTLPGVSLDSFPKLPPLPAATDQPTKARAEERATSDVKTQNQALDTMRDQASQAARNNGVYTQLEKKLANANPREFGPSSSSYKALAGLKTYLSGIPPEGLVNQAEVDKYLSQLGVPGSKQLLGEGQQLRQQELLMLMAHANPNIDQPLQVIKNLVAYGKAGNDYDLRAANTGIAAIRNGADPFQVPGAIENQSHRADYISHALGTPPKTVVRTGTHNGQKVVQYSDGTLEYAK